MVSVEEETLRIKTNNFLNMTEKFAPTIARLVNRDAGGKSWIFGIAHG